VKKSFNGRWVTALAFGRSVRTPSTNTMAPNAAAAPIRIAALSVRTTRRRSTRSTFVLSMEMSSSVLMFSLLPCNRRGEGL